jgi:hypothetical protein
MVVLLRCGVGIRSRQNDVTVKALIGIALAALIIGFALWIGKSMSGSFVTPVRVVPSQAPTPRIPVAYGSVLLEHGKADTFVSFMPADESGRPCPPIPIALTSAKLGSCVANGKVPDWKAISRSIGGPPICIAFRGQLPPRGTSMLTLSYRSLDGSTKGEQQVRVSVTSYP